MNDRFKFRVWDNENNEYLDEAYPSSIYSDGSLYAFEEKYDANSNEMVALEIPNNRLIVEQCTGLRDKNGRLIYEGDIVSFQSRGLFFEGTVVWTQEEVFSEINLGRFHIKLLEYQGCEYDFMDYSRDRDSLEVVGTIHEVEK